MLFPIAPEGRLFVVGTAILAVLTLLNGLLDMGLFLVILTVAWMALFRDLPRRAPVSAMGVVAPVDGVVESVEKVRDPFTGKPARRIRLRQRRLGEYNIHAPQEAKVTERVWPGKEGGGEPDAQLERRLAFALETDEGFGMTLAVGLEHHPRMIRMQHVLPGNRVGRGKRIGFAGFGGTFEVWLPAASQIMVEPGQKVLAGATQMGGLPEPGGGAAEGSVEVLE